MSMISNKKAYFALATVLLVGLALGWMGGIFQAHRRSLSGLDRSGVVKTFDENQRKIFREIRHSHREEMQSLREELEAASEAFDEAVRQEKSPEVLREQYAKIVELRTKRDWAQFDMTMQMRPHLRPEQMQHLRMHEGQRGRSGRGRSGRK